MALTITSTVGGSASNSFVTVAEMTTYCEGRLNASVWVATPAQEPALVEATRELSMMDWLGLTVSETQALSWPRQYVPDPESPSGQYFASTEIPQRIKDATCELALQFLKAGTTDISAASTTDGVIEKTVDVLTTRWADPRALKQGIKRYPSVYRFIRPLLAANPGVVVTLVRS